MGTKYVLLKSITTNKLVKLILDDSYTYTLRTDEILDLGQGCQLTARRIDVNGKKFWLVFTEDGKYIDDRILSTGDTWTCTLDKIQGKDIVNVLKFHVTRLQRYSQKRGLLGDNAQKDGLW